MTMDTSLVDLDLLNSCSADQFADLLDGILENASWLTRGAAAARPFADVSSLHSALMDQISALSESDLVAFLCGHPELAGPEARAGTMTALSTQEQGRLDLGTLQAEQSAFWNSYNREYRQRFGFPFIIRVAEHNTDSLLSSAKQRLGNPRQLELQNAGHEIAKISRSRLAKLLE